jgi:hypothetical protein
MRALLDSAYDATRHYSHRDPLVPEAIKAIAETHPGCQDCDYVDAYEAARRLKEFALDLADKWCSRLLAESEARERLMRECPGFDAGTYDKAWSQATHFIWR